MSLRIFGEDVTPQTKPPTDKAKENGAEETIAEPAVSEEAVVAATREEQAGQTL